MPGLSHADATALRATPGATVVLFITDRCPLECSHCSVSSLGDSPSITDWPLFTAVVDGLCDVASLRAVAITGGEPFAERRGLTYAVEALHAAGKQVVVFTGGYWARHPAPAWITRILCLTSTVYLSLDSFHAAALSGRRPGDAVRAITSAGCRLVLQVLDEPGAVEAARALSPDADLSVIQPVRHGRGATVFGAPPPRRPAEFGRCTLVNSPTFRYDGTVSACCNEAVIMGRGPAGLRRRVAGRADVAMALAAFRHDPALRVIGRYGPAGVEPVVAGPVRSVCESCWALQDAVAGDPAALALATVLGGE
jgi:hypothetical protein